MFERAFIPFVKQQEECDGIRDPIDQCVAYYFNKVKEVHSMTYYACMYTVWHILDMYTVWHMLHMLHMSQNLQ